MLISGTRNAQIINTKLRTTFYLDFSDSLTSTEEFVADISKIKSEIIARHGERVVDAKSLMGFMNISHLPLEVSIVPISDDDLRLFNDICKKYKEENYVK